MTDMPRHDKKRYSRWADRRRIYIEERDVKTDRAEMIRNHAANNPACRRWS